jgi:putative colanic acid biosynthesis glycosyltransferase
MTAPMFSIITVCLNDKNGLIRTQESIRRQNNADYEWIVIDGASQDGTPEFLVQLPVTECRWLSEPDKGLYDAMNKGIERATGQYLLFLNSGDEFAASDVLQEISNKLPRDSMPGFIYGDSLERSNEGSIIYKMARHHKYIWYGMFTHHQSMLYGKETLNGIRYRSEYRIAADYALTSELLTKRLTILCVSFPISIFEGGGITSSPINHWLGMTEQWRIGRIILKRSVFQCLETALLHISKHLFVRIFPGLHRRMRYGKR